MFASEWFPKAYVLGISWAEFWHMNPKIILAHKEGYLNTINEKNSMFHLQGMYFRDALLSTVGNMFKSKGTKDFEYPEHPYELDMGKGKAELTESEKEEQTRALFQRLELMQANFMLAHGGKG